MRTNLERLISKGACIKYEDKCYESDDIFKRAYKLGNLLLSKLEKSNSICVAIYLERGEGVIISMLASLACGATYVLIEPDFPEERLQYILENADVGVIIANKEKHSKFEGREVICYEDIDNYQVATCNMEPLENEIAYICYTSGTTGMPKGVEVTRKALENFRVSMEQILNLKQGQSIACFTTCMFDIFYFESVVPIIIGMTVHLLSQEAVSNPRKIKKYLEKQDIDIVQMTPSRMQMLLFERKIENALKNIKTFVIGGEVFPISLLMNLKKYACNAQIYNFYGPTETTIWSTYKNVTKAEKITVGKPIHNTEVKIMKDGKPVTQGSAGEIYIGGTGLARGYKKMEVYTNEKYVYYQGTRYYRTGDSGAINEEGELVCYGRLDNQIKINGHRVECEDIENVIMQYEAIHQAVTYYIGNGIDKKLVVLYTAEKEVSSKEMINFLEQKLPNYMIPHIYVYCEKLYYNNNGKIDRKQNKEKYLTQVG